MLSAQNNNKNQVAQRLVIKDLTKREEENTGKNAFTSIVFLADNVEVTWSLPEERTLEQRFKVVGR